MQAVYVSKMIIIFSNAFCFSGGLILLTTKLKSRIMQHITSAYNFLTVSFCSNLLISRTYCRSSTGKVVSLKIPTIVVVQTNFQF